MTRYPAVGIILGLAAVAGATAAATAAPPPSHPPLLGLDLGKASPAHHTCARPLARNRPVPVCVAEIAARAQRLLGNSHPSRRSWVATTAGRAGLYAPTARTPETRKRVLVARIIGDFPQGGPPAAPYGPFGELRFVVDPTTRRVLKWMLDATPTTLPPLNTLGHARLF